jgi:hypothetical protein
LRAERLASRFLEFLLQIVLSKTSIMRVITLVATLLFTSSLTLHAQLRSGPIVGGVTTQTAKVYVRFMQEQNFVFRYSQDSLFAAYDSLILSVNANTFNSAQIEMQGLQPNTRYYYRLFDNAADTFLSTRRTFKTFPVKNSGERVRLIVGSCNYNNMPGGGQSNPNFKNDLMFQAMVDFDPHLFLHLGDWGYPPSFLGANHLASPALAAESFSVRYSDPNMSEYILPNMAIDYIYDDDYNHNNTAGWTYPINRTETLPGGAIKYVLEDRDHLPGLRDSAIKEYFKHFPAYPQQDTSGIHHLIELGDVAIYVTDIRSSKTPIHAPFKYNAANNRYTFEPDSNHTSLGALQTLWLLDGLKNNNANWKVLATSVLFNQKIKLLMDIVLFGQAINRELVNFASSLAYMWAAYPKDLDAVLNHVDEHKLKDIVVFSGDTHSSMMDDGENAGLPELSSSGLSADDEGYLNYTIDSIGKEFGINLTVKNDLWNSGGSGIDNANFSDTYATVEFFGSDSVVMCVIDEFLQTLACMTIIHSSKKPLGIRNVFSNDFLLLYPNPAKDEIRLQLNHSTSGKYYIVDITGRQLTGTTVLLPEQLDATIDIRHLPAGQYRFVLETPQGMAGRNFIRK